MKNSANADANNLNNEYKKFMAELEGETLPEEKPAVDDKAADTTGDAMNLVTTVYAAPNPNMASGYGGPLPPGSENLMPHPPFHPPFPYGAPPPQMGFPYGMPYMAPGYFPYGAPPPPAAAGYPAYPGYAMPPPPPPQ